MIILMQGLVETFAVVLISFVLIPQVSCLNVVVEVSSNAKRLEHWNFTVDLARKAAQYRDKFLQSTTSKARPGREVTFNRRLCVLGSDVKNKQAQKAEIVDIGDVVQLPCRLCDNDMQRSRDAHVWFKFYRYVNDASPGQSAWKVSAQTSLTATIILTRSRTRGLWGGEGGRGHRRRGIERDEQAITWVYLRHDQSLTFVLTLTHTPDPAP